MNHPLSISATLELQQIVNATGCSCLVTRTVEDGAHFYPFNLIEPFDAARTYFILSTGNGSAKLFNTERELIEFARTHFGQSMAPTETE